ncbi:hypothetical protein V8C42DRAFT_342317 [Trichoderma barbatum]
MDDLEENRSKELAEGASSGLFASLDGATDSKSAIDPLQAIAWMIVNTLATVGIASIPQEVLRRASLLTTPQVFTNKAIFSEPLWKKSQLTFAFIHFLMTWFILFLLSRSSIGVFVPRRTPKLQLIPLAAAMCFNVILPNLSLAYSTVTFYQIARILLTPTVAVMNFVLYKRVLPRGAIVSLIPACLGVGMVTYYDSIPADDEVIKTTSPIGIIFAFAGIFASSLYTVWIAGYHRKLNMNSMQLLYLQAPMACFLLFFFIPFVDDLPHLQHISFKLNKGTLVFASTVFASLVNISQFYIVAQTGPVSSTVVGHIKTCTIVGLGWAMSGRTISDSSAVGVMVAVVGIISHKRVKADVSEGVAMGKM